MKTKLADKALRKTSMGNGLYGRQWMAKDSLTIGTDAYPAKKVLWPVYC